MKSRQLLLDRTIDSAALLKLTQQFAYEEGTCLLYSGTSYETAQHSFLFLFPFEVISIQSGIKQRCSLNGQALISNEANPWKAFKDLGSDIGKGDTSFPEWVGFFGYEMGAHSDDDITMPHLSASTPEAYWQHCAVTLKVDHQTEAAVVRLIDDEKICFDDHVRYWLMTLSEKKGWDELLDKDLPVEPETKQQVALKSISDTKESYLNKIQQAKEFIKSGDVYQVNLSQQWEFFGQCDPFDLFKQLTALNPAPFSVYFHLKEFSIISSSPERFLQKKGQILEARPIKGTAPRGKTVAEDVHYKNHLLHSVKERAELMMITDLMRNDLGKMSETGSVEVPLLCGCEAYRNVFHLYSIVRSHVLSSLGPIDIVRGCFPGGSITGCPKLRAMEVIAELELRPRGIYTGSIGYFAENGDFDFNIAIRTMVLQNLGIPSRYDSKVSGLCHQKINVQLGGAIVIDSDPLKEYEETYHKGESIFKILQGYND